MNKNKYLHIDHQRRALIVAGVSLPALVGAGAVHAQMPNKVWRVGFLSPRHLDFVDADSIYGPFTQGMRELGYIVGKNLLIEWRSSEGKAERLPQLAAELVRLKPDALATGGTPAALAARKATTTIPIVMINVGDPVGSGLIKSLARPGGNITGLSNLSAELGAKRLEMLLAMAPKVTRVAVLVSPSNASHIVELKNIQAAAQKLGVNLQIVEAGTPEEIVKGFAVMAHQNAGALFVAQDAFFIQQTRQIVELVTKQRLPSIGGYGEYVEAGGLMSYGQNNRENFRRAATYVDKIFKGANPGDLPVEQPTQFELFINLKTAKALGLTVPQSILLQATKVIE